MRTRRDVDTLTFNAIDDQLFSVFRPENVAKFVEMYNASTAQNGFISSREKLKKIIEYDAPSEKEFFMGTLKLKPKPTWKYIRSNRYAKKIPVKRTETDCHCSYENPCDSDCINHKLSVECNPKYCPAKEKCQNQCFRRGQVIETTLKNAGFKGVGLFTLEKIPADTFIIEYVGEIITGAELDIRRKQLRCENGHLYFMELGKGMYIDSGRFGNHARFINHSCSPNTRPEKWIVDNRNRIGLFANRDIAEVRYIGQWLIAIF